MSAADDLRAARERLGISQAEVARRWGVSPRMVRKIERGEVPGLRYSESIAQLGRGRSVPPERRLTAAGAPVRVRASRAAVERGEGPSVAPTPPEPAVERGAFGVQVDYTPGTRSVTVTMPRTEGMGRERGRIAIMDELRRGAQGHRGRGGRGQRVRFGVHTTDGRDYEVGGKGGYNPSTALAGARDFGNDPLGWLEDQLDGAGYEVPKRTIVRVTLTYFS